MAGLMGSRRLVGSYLRGMPRPRTSQASLALLNMHMNMAAATAVAPMAQPRRSYNESSSNLTWKQFLEGGSRGVSGAVAHEGGHRVKLSWVDGHTSEFSLKWLRDHSPGAFNAHTKQREV